MPLAFYSSKVSSSVPSHLMTCSAPTCVWKAWGSQYVMQRQPKPIFHIMPSLSVVGCRFVFLLPVPEAGGVEIHGGCCLKALSAEKCKACEDSRWYRDACRCQGTCRGRASKDCGRKLAFEVKSKWRWVRHLGKRKQNLLRHQNVERVSWRKEHDLDVQVDSWEYQSEDEIANVDQVLFLRFTFRLFLVLFSVVFTLSLP